MDSQSVINFVGGAVLAVLGWAAKELWSVIKELQAEIKDVQINYVKKDEFTDHMNRIETKLDRIFEKLDSKADR